MPWTWVARALFALIFYRVMQRRRRGLPALDVEDLRHRIETGRHAGVIVARVVTAATLGFAAIILGTAGTSTLILGPRWLGGVLAALALFFAAACIQEVMVLRRELVIRRRQRLAEKVVLEVKQGP